MTEVSMSFLRVLMGAAALLSCIHSQKEVTAICPSAGFRCKGGLCLSERSVCDRVPDCPLGDDEHDCSMDCGIEDFRCRNGHCIERPQFCDGTRDCRDGTDEEDCPIVECGEAEYRCRDETCVGNGERCDGVTNCPDGSDEQNCDAECDIVPPERIVIPEKSGVGTAIGKFWVRCTDNHTVTSEKWSVSEELDGQLFHFDGSMLRNQIRINKPPQKSREVIVKVRYKTASDEMVTANKRVQILIVEKLSLDTLLSSEDLHVELFGGVRPGTAVWSLKQKSLNIWIQRIHKYVEDFQVTPDNLTIVTSRRLSDLPATVELPITLYSNDSDYRPQWNTSLTIELRAISEPVITRVVAVNKSYADVCWRVPKHGVSRQKFMLERNDTVISEIRPPTNQEKVCALVHGLRLGAKYMFVVRAVFGNLTGVTSQSYYYNHSVTDPCSPNPCQHNGRCQRQNYRFKCQCQPGYIGQTCGTRDPCDEVTCPDGEVCTTLDDTEYLCRCPNENCRDMCQPNPCENGGTCSYNGTERRCLCARGFGGSTCATRVAVYCPNSTVVSPRGVFHWPATPYGEELGYLACPESTGGRSWVSRRWSWVSRRCVLTSDLRTVWLPQDDSACPKTNLTQSAVETVIETIQNKDTSTEDADGLGKIVTVLNDVSEIAAQSPEKAEKFIRAIDNVLDATPTNLQVNNTNTRLTKTLEDFLDAVALDKGQSVQLNLKNIKLSIRNLSEEATKGGVQFTARDEDGGSSQTSSSIVLPGEVFSKMATKEFRVNFVLYMSNKLFPVGNKGTANSSLGKVLMASVNNQTVSGLTRCVRYTLTKPTNSETQGVFKCVFWNTKERQWSTEGVSKVSEDELSVHCCSTHLTNFAILLDVDPDVRIDRVQNDMLSIVTYVGCSLSIIGVTLTLITYSIFPCLHRSNSGKILLNLGSSMLCMHLLFLVGGARAVVGHRELCTAIAALLHYTVVTTMMWMGVEAMNLYQVLVRVFETYEKHFLLKRMLVGWVIPSSFVVASLAVDFDNYWDRRQTSCHISSRNSGVYYGTYIAPVCLVLASNLVIFFVLLRVLLRPRFDKNLGRRTVTGAQIRGVMSVLALLGITWIFGALAIGDAKLALNYLFVITTSLQGFCIFVFRCLRNYEAQAAWRQLWNEGTFKTRRGAIIKTSGPTNTTSTRDKRPISETDESLQKHFPADDKYDVDADKLGKVTCQKGTFWLNRYRETMGLEKNLTSTNNNYESKT